jgi:transcriptional regulator with XRE-family HTH domain
MFAAAQDHAATGSRLLSTFLLVEQFDPVAVGTRIATARKHADGMTQEQLADLIGVATRTLQTYEQGDRIPWKHLRDISTVLNCPLEWLLRGEPEATEAEPGLTGRHLEDIEEKLDRLTTVVEHLAESLAAARSDPDDGQSGQTGS